MEKVFSAHFEAKNVPEKVSLTKAPLKPFSGRSELRKRLANLDLKKETTKSSKIQKTAKKEKAENEIPKDFLKLLDELGLDKKDAKNLYENPDSWKYIKSDRKITCCEIGNFFFSPINLIFVKIFNKINCFCL